MILNVGNFWGLKNSIFQGEMMQFCRISRTGEALKLWLIVLNFPKPLVFRLISERFRPIDSQFWEMIFFFKKAVYEIMQVRLFFQSPKVPDYGLT